MYMLYFKIIIFSRLLLFLGRLWVRHFRERHPEISAYMVEKQKEEKVANAIQAVNLNRMTISEASRQFGVPRSTVCDRYLALNLNLLKLLSNHL